MMTERALAAGVSEILKKPVLSRALAAALARVIRRGRLARGPATGARPGQVLGQS
jgi:hypothetical protein